MELQTVGLAGLLGWESRVKRWTSPSAWWSADFSFADLYPVVPITPVRAALSIVSSRHAFWEVASVATSLASHSGTEPAAIFESLASTSPFEYRGWLEDDVDALSTMTVLSQMPSWASEQATSLLSVPTGVLLNASRILSTALSADMLSTSCVTMSNLDVCVERCGVKNPPCLLECLDEYGG